MTKVLWTENEIKILDELYSKNTNIQEIAKIINKSDKAITSKANKIGLTKKYIKKNNANFKAIYQDYDWCYQNYIINGYSFETMASLCGASVRVIEKWCREKYGLCNRTAKQHIKLTNKQRELITFSLLGDGHIDKREKEPLFIVSHAENQKEYLYWKYELLKNICNKEPSYIKGGYKDFNGKSYLCQPAYRCCTKVILDLIPIRNLSKHEIIQNINEFGLSIFMLDDGYRGETTWELCVADFSEEDRIFFIDKMKTSFNLNCKLKKDTRYIGFNTDSSKCIDTIILNNIPSNLDIVKYKILNKQKKVS